MKQRKKEKKKAPNTRFEEELYEVDGTKE